MEKIRVDVSWVDKNFGAMLGSNVPGAVVLTAKTYEELIKEVPRTLLFHINGMIADGDEVPQWLRDGDYVFDYHLDTAAVIRSCERYASIASMARASGMNERQLSHYANGTKHARTKQRERIIAGLHKIGEELIAVE